MELVTSQAEISSDGKLHLELSTNLPPGPVEIVVIFQPTSARLVGPSQGGSNLSTPKARSGIFVGKARHEIDIDAALDEMNTAWKAKFLDIHS